MKKIICFLLVAVMCIGIVGCNPAKNPKDKQTFGEDTSGEDTTRWEKDDEFESARLILAVCSFKTTQYDLNTLITSGRNFKVSQNGQELDGMNVRLNVGTNVFRVTATVNSVKRNYEVRIARRDGYRVVFNTNGGSFVETQYVKEGAIINEASVIPTRNGYNFMGWYDDLGEKVELSSTPILNDTTFTARWSGPTSSFAKSYDPIEYTTSSAALNIVWKDYDNAFKVRPTDVTCELKNMSTNTSYTVKVTKTTAEFVGGSPAGASISQGAGNWTVKITGLTDEYTFVANKIDGKDYTLTQSGTSVVCTIENYTPAIDDTAWLMSENGRLYDLAGNVTVLKGVVTLNVGWGNLSKTTSIAALKRLQKDGVNCIRVTVMAGGTNGYWLISGTTEQTAERRAELVKTLKAAIDNAISIGMYCIINWGVSMGDVETGTHAQYMKNMQTSACELFSKLAKDYKDSPYVIYEVCNEPAVPGADGWGNHVRVFEETVIRVIREAGTKGLVIAGPNMYARNISEYNSNDDPINKPISTEISYNVAYTFHSYAIQFPYDYDYRGNEKYNYGWRLCDAIKAGLTIVATEFNPGDANKYPIGDTSGKTWDIEEANKFLNVMLENDVSYMFFRYMSDWGTSTTTSAHEMFLPGYVDVLSKGTWTMDMMGATGKWFYDSALDSTGFIKAADFSYRGKASVQKSAS